MNTIRSVRKAHGRCCCCTGISDGQCSLKPPPSPFLILSGSLYQKNHDYSEKLSDAIVMWRDREGEYVVVAELKAGNVPRTAVAQLRNGAEVASEFVGNCSPKFAAALVTKRAPHSLDRKFIARQRIIFAGSAYSIVTVRCGSPVVEAIK